MFTQGRHKYLSFMITMQDEKLLETEFKKNAFISIFTTSQNANAFFTRKSSYFSRDVIKRAERAARDTFNSEKKYQKLIFIREEDKFYRYTATLRGSFTVGSDIINEYCEKVKRKHASSGGKWYKMLTQDSHDQ